MAAVILKDAIARAKFLLVETGMDEAKAERTAHLIVASDAWGIGSHGLMRLDFYLKRLRAGGINPKASLKTVTDLPGLLVLDGEAGIGHWQLEEAAKIAAERCKTQGVAAVAIGNSSHCGALGLYVWPMINAGVVGIAMSTGPAVMPPWGGDKPILSTSPIAAGIPTNPPTVVDLATSAVARGKIAAKAQAGAPLEPGWAFTKEGQPTVDPQEALAGMLAPLGGVKGYAIAVLVESLTGLLIGPSLAKDIPDMFDSKEDANHQAISHLVIAIDADKLSVDGQSRREHFVDSVQAAGGRLPGSGRLNPYKLDQGSTITITDAIAAELGL